MNYKYKPPKNYFQALTPLFYFFLEKKEGRGSMDGLFKGCHMGLQGFPMKAE